MSNNMVTDGLASQLLAALYMLKDCIDRCPDAEWDERHNDYPFSQVVFHTLFDCDYHLCDNPQELVDQPFHKTNSNSFADYEELDDGRIPKRLYERDFICLYYDHCRKRAESVIRAKSTGDLVIPNTDIRRVMTRLERYVNAIRHMQHHVAQLGLRLQFLTGNEMNWVSSACRS